MAGVRRLGRRGVRARGRRPATAALQLRPVVAESTPAVVAAPAGTAPGAGTQPPALETLATGGCANLPAAADPPRDEPLVTCSATGDMAYRLGPVEVPGTEIVSASAAPAPGDPTSWVVNLKASEAGTARIADVTRRLSGNQPPENQLAVVVNGLVVTAPAVQAAITAGEVQIGGTFTRQDAEDLAARLTGRTP